MHHRISSSAFILICLAQLASAQLPCVGTVGDVSDSVPIMTANRLALTPDGARLYVLGQQPNPINCQLDVFVVDTATNTVMAGSTTPLGVGGNIQSIAVRPDGAELWIPRGDVCGSNMTTNTGTRLEIVDVAANTLQTVMVGGSNFGFGEIVFSPDSSTAYVAHHGDHLMRVYDTGARTQTTTVSFGPDEVIGLAITPNGNEVYGVAGVPTPGVYAVDTTNLAATPTYVPLTTPAATGTHAVASPDGKRIYAGFSAQPGMSTDVHVIDSDPSSPTWHQQIAVISMPVGASTNDLGLSASGNELLVTRNVSNTLIAVDIDLTSPTFHQIVAMISLPATVIDVVGANATAATAYVSSSDSHVVSVIGEPYQGSAEDLILLTDVTPVGMPGFPTACPSIKPANQGNALTVVLDSPMGTLDFALPVLVAQIFPTGTPPTSPSGFPEVAVNPTAPVPPSVLFDGSTCGLAPCYLPPQGFAIVGTAPLFLSGFSIMFQGLSVTNAAANGFFAATNGHEIRIL